MTLAAGAEGVGMRTICDVCEGAPAVLFCAADEAALCRACDEKVISAPRSPPYPLVHMCNKLASRHVRVGLANSNKLARCDICEIFPAFFHCEIDGTSLCLSCDMTVHVGGKRTHGRYLLLRQSVEFPGDKLGHMDDDVAMQSKDPENQIDQKKPPHSAIKEQMANHHSSSDDPASDGNCDDQLNLNSKMIDLNMRPVRTNGQGSNSQTQGVDVSMNNHDSPGVVPTSNYEGDANK
ncbi:B-box zinc finger protein 18-like isoform X2 [Panicum virgatum]|uniref:B-box zinc finger protein 18-like isoform X2 n=1 Tax=Panicum virgatum TaxID=38727 RepID=UPI0019D56322|nr:B-box zinc finger protein 18-like isoform X2 [Panicum virgatum]